MDFETFISRLEEVRDIGRIENGYSHIIYDVMYDVLDSKKYMLVDVSTYKRKPINIKLLGENLCAVPDFVITNKTTLLDKIERYGCIEVKFKDSDVDGARLYDKGGKNGYLTIYNKHVIYTNGWIWKYYNENGEKKKPCWEFDFREEKQKNEKTFEKLKRNLKEIKWSRTSQI